LKVTQSETMSHLEKIVDEKEKGKMREKSMRRGLKVFDFKNWLKKQEKRKLSFEIDFNPTTVG